jgi:hypothetical protein
MNKLQVSSLSTFVKRLGVSEPIGLPFWTLLVLLCPIVVRV